MIDKRALVRQYKEAARPMGVYAVCNLSTQRAYLGSSMNLDAAFNRQRFALRLGSHPHRRLQQDWTRLGEGQFRFEVLDTLKPSEDPARDRRGELDELLAMWRDEFDRLGRPRY